MSFEETTDSTDLCEYDEFDSYDEKTYQATSSTGFTEYGVPLSVELSESLYESQTLINKHPADCFVKAPEIFLRFDLNITSATDNDSNVSNELKNSEKTISIESKENDNVDYHDDCVELQYENEFEDPDDEFNDDNAQLIYKRNNRSDNDYDELFLEGIK